MPFPIRSLLPTTLGMIVLPFGKMLIRVIRDLFLVSCTVSQAVSLLLCVLGARIAKCVPLL